jgi:hypothetical protein
VLGVPLVEPRRLGLPAEVHAARRLRHADQKAAAHLAQHLRAVVHQVAAAVVAGSERDRHAAVGVADAHGAEADLEHAEHLRRLKRQAAMVLAVADQHEIGIAGRQLAERLHCLAHGLADRGAAARHAVGRGVVKALQEQAVVARQRALHVGAAGEGEQTEPVAAIALHRERQRARRSFGLGEPVGRHVLGEHAGGHVQEHDHIAPAQRQLLAPRPPLRPHQCDHEARRGRGQAERPRPAAPVAGRRQHPRRQLARDERGQRQAPAAERVGEQGDDRGHQHEQVRGGPGGKAHARSVFREWRAGGWSPGSPRAAERPGRAR